MKAKQEWGAALLEYSMLIIIIVLVIFATQVYTKRAMMGYWRQMTDTFGFGRQYGEVADPDPDPCYCGDGICNCGETADTCSDCFIPPSNPCWTNWCWTLTAETEDPCLPVLCNVCEPDPPSCQPCGAVKEDCCHSLVGGGCQYYHCNANSYYEGCGP